MNKPLTTLSTSTAVVALVGAGVTWCQASCASTDRNPPRH